jgi:hypothetical protein
MNEKNEQQTETEVDDIVMKLTKDLRKAAVTLGPREVRFLVDAYYTMQENRIRAAGQVRSMSGEPHKVLDWLSDKSDSLEAQVRAALDAWSASQPMGKWARNVTGIGPVLAAGLLAHIDVAKCCCKQFAGLKSEDIPKHDCEGVPTVGHIWRFAGLDPTLKWEKGKKRPWNASLKVICWKIGESFVKVSGNESDVYGKLYFQRKAIEIQNNDSGKLAGAAAAGAERVAKNTDAWPWYSGCFPAGASKIVSDLKDEKARKQWLKENKLEPGKGQPMLPPGHLHSRAKRWSVKLFLSHWHDAAYRNAFGKAPPLPYPIAVLGHAHMINSH